MTRVKWKLTLTAMGDEPAVDEWGDKEPVRLGNQTFDLLAELAKDPENGLVEIAPGVYRGPLAP